MTEEQRNDVVVLKDIHLWRQRPILQGINWTVERGQHWVVLGRNGAGKTLLLKITAGYLWPSRGEVHVLAERFGAVDLRELRQDIGWVSSALAEKIPDWDTALNVVLSGAYATFGLYHRPEAALVEAAERLMAEMGLLALKDQQFGDMSAGEKQRVILARSRLPRPNLLILDEPCAGLDLAAREKLLALVSAMARDPNGPTLLMVTHRVSEIPAGFTHAMLMHQGRAMASGRLQDVLTDRNFSRAMEVEVRLSQANGRWQARVVTPAGR
jgi:iron complex transport system ATP-binding protein